MMRPWIRIACAVVLALTMRTPVRAETVTARVTVAGRGKKKDSSNVVLWLTPLSDPQALQPAQAERGKAPFRLIQRGKTFVPHVLIVPVGTDVEFPNLDPFFHNVFSLFNGKRFDLGLYEAGTTRSVRFDRLGICYIFCNIHPEMSAVVVVVKTPYFGLSSRGGEIKIQDVPPGRYQMEVWYEKGLPEEVKSLSHEITISDTPSFLGTFRLSESGNPLGLHKNKYGVDYDTPNSPDLLYEQP
jgi:plastocyanin